MSGILCLFLSALLVILAPDTTQAEAPLSAPRTVTAALQADYPPTCFKDPAKGVLQGFAIDLMDEVARRAGVKVRYVAGRTWQQSQEMLLDGRADVIPALTIDETRRKRFAFTSPIDILPISYIVRNDGMFNGLRSGMRVGVMRGSEAHMHLLDRNDVRLMPHDSLRRLLSGLLSGDLDIVLAPTPSMVKLALDLGLEGHLRILEPPVLEGVRAMAVRPGDSELLARLNRALGDFVGTPEYRAIYFKWWGKPKPFWTTARVAWVVGVTMVLCALAMGYWRYVSVLRLNRTLGQTLEQLERSRAELLRSGEYSRCLAQTADRERARSQAILEGIQDGISIQDREYRILYQNPHLIGMVGEHPGEQCYRAYQHKEAPCEGCPLTATFRDGLPHRAALNQACLKGTLYNDVLASPLRDEQGEIVSVITNIRDITSRKQMEDALHEQAMLLQQEVVERQQAQESLAAQQRQLEELNKILARGINEAVSELRHKDQMLIQQGRQAAMGEMIHNIAHQWRQPLNNVGLIIQNIQIALQSGKTDVGEINRDIASAMDSILHMSRTIDDFRSFFLQEREKRRFDVNQVVARSIELVAATLQDSNIQVEVISVNGASAVGYPNEYAQVLLNILGNARDALMERRVTAGRITIRTGTENGRSVVTIRDNGGGIAEDILPKVFDPYFTTKEPGKGTGIGLYMSKVIIEQHMEGRLSARNAEDGAEFRIEV